MGLEDQCVSGHALVAQGELRGVVVGVQIFRAGENSEFYFCNANVYVVYESVNGNYSV